MASLSAAIRRKGVELDSDVQTFWDAVAESMPPESPEQKALMAIGKELKRRHLVLFVESMLTLSREEVSRVVHECGGNLNWIVSVEQLLGQSFPVACPNAPPSACLVSDEARCDRKEQLPVTGSVAMPVVLLCGPRVGARN